MLSAKDIAIFFMQLDNEGMFSDTTLQDTNGRFFYVGRARLNKYLHLAQNIYYAKTSELLFSEPLYAYDNGGVVEDVRQNYDVLLKKKDSKVVELDDDIKLFLMKLFVVLKNADINKLIELSHEDPEWLSKHNFYNKSKNCLNHSSCILANISISSHSLQFAKIPTITIIKISGKKCQV